MVLITPSCWAEPWKPDLGSRGPDVSILSYHGNKFVSGLFWRPLSSQRQYMKEARKLGKEEHLDIVAIRHSPTVIQAGFVSKSQGAVKGMYSWPRRFQASSTATSWPAGKSTRTATRWSPRSMAQLSPGRMWSPPSTRPGPGQEALYARRAAKRTGLRSRRVRFPRQGLRHRGAARAEAPAARLPPPATHLRLVRQEWTAVALLGCLVGGSLTAYYLWNAHQQELARQAALSRSRGASPSWPRRTPRPSSRWTWRHCRSLGRSCLTSRTCYAPVARQRGTVAVDPGLALRIQQVRRQGPGRHLPPYRQQHGSRPDSGQPAPVRRPPRLRHRQRQHRGPEGRPESRHR